MSILDDSAVGSLRALPAPLALAALDQLEADLGPEAVGALGTAWDFWRRSVQRFPTAAERPAIVVYTGGYGAGKTRTAWELLLHLVATGRAITARIIAATGADARRLVEHRRTGILAHRKPGVRYDWQSSKGFEGELGIDNATIALLSVEAPKTALGDGCDVQILDDPPKWGPSGKAALVAALKSARERGALTIIPTTADGLELLSEVLGGDLEAAGVLVIDLGTSEANAGNLDESYYVVKAALERAGLWNPTGSPSPWAQLTPEQWRAMRTGTCPPLVELAVSIDPNLSAGSRSCACGLVGGGRDARAAVHVLANRSAVLDAGVNGWPAAAWDLAEALQREHPGVPWHFVLEANTGKRLAELLRGEERVRRLRAGKPEVSICDIRFVRADKDKCKRAVSPARLAAQGQVKHELPEPGRSELEGQQRNLTPTSTESDAADAENHLITDLAGLSDEKGAAEAREELEAETTTRASFVGLRQAQRPFTAPAFRGGRV